MYDQDLLSPGGFLLGLLVRGPCMLSKQLQDAGRTWALEAGWLGGEPAPVTCVFSYFLICFLISEVKYR